jgi:hypothetical protein
MSKLKALNDTLLFKHGQWTRRSRFNSFRQGLKRFEIIAEPLLPADIGAGMTGIGIHAHPLLFLCKRSLSVQSRFFFAPRSFLSFTTLSCLLALFPAFLKSRRHDDVGRNRCKADSERSEESILMPFRKKRYGKHKNRATPARRPVVGVVVVPEAISSVCGNQPFWIIS